MDYPDALENAIVYVEEHLAEPLTADLVARAAGYSYFHLTRQFQALLGEGIGSYIKKRRLADSAKKLLAGRSRIIDIAYDSGFESPEAFSRAFKNAYGVSPARYRKNGLDLCISAKERLDSALLRHRTQCLTVHPRLVDFPLIRAAGLRGKTTLRHNLVPALWEQFWRAADRIPHRAAGARFFGICEACVEGQNLYRMNPDEVFSEVAAVEVDSFDGLPAPFAAKTIGGGRYAVFTHRGSLSTLAKTFDYIWGTWFLQTGLTVDGREDFELYDNRFAGYDNPASEIDICIPVCGE